MQSLVRMFLGKKKETGGDEEWSEKPLVPFRPMFL